MFDDCFNLRNRFGRGIAAGAPGEAAKRWIANIGAAIVLLSLSCSDNISDNPTANQPPNTYISIFSQNQLNPAISRQTFNWWGDDPDGIVAGFIYTFNPNATSYTSWAPSQTDPDWVYTEDTKGTFILSLAGSDTTFTFWVKAIDDQGAADPDGAIQDYRIVNTPPSVEFPVATDVPETTFTVATFVWSGTDLDGDDTISKYQYTLDDTTDNAAWRELPSSQTSITLKAADGLTNGPHVFYLRVVDLAGVRSRIVSMPRNPEDTWFVKEPQSDFLIVDDYNVADNAANFYGTTIRNIVGPVDVWDIKSGGNALEPPTSAAFLETLKLFKRVFWYGDSSPNLEKAQVSLRDYVEAGGKVLMTTSFKEFATNLGDPLDFSPADSLGKKINRLTRNQTIAPTAEYATMGFPELQVNVAIIPNVFPVVPKISSETIYELPAKPGSWEGTPPVGVIDAGHNFVFFGIPLMPLNGQGTVPQLFQLLLNSVLVE